MDKSYYNLDYYEFRNVVSRAVPIEIIDYPDLISETLTVPNFSQRIRIGE